MRKLNAVMEPQSTTGRRQGRSYRSRSRANIFQTFVGGGLAGEISRNIDVELGFEERRLLVVVS